jgi:glycosyltransferase involved in cell wall biosynthesis
MSPAGTISVVVCTHDTKRFDRLRQAIDSVMAQTAAAHEVILVVDGNDEVLSAASAAFPTASVMPNARTKGLSGARNTGLLAASGEIVAFLDDDAIAERDWLAAIASQFASPFTMGVGGPITPSWPGERPRWMPREFDWVVGCSYEGQATETGTVRNLIGCNMAFRRSALIMAGLFDEGLGRNGANAAGAEETELCLRAGAMFPMAGLVMDDKAAVRHQIEEHRKAFGYFARRCIAEGKSKALMTHRHPSRSGLSSERHHLLTVIPRRILGHLADGFSRPGQGGFSRAAASIIGTALVAGSFLVGRIAVRRLPRAESAFAPFKVVEVDVSQPLLPIAANGADDGQPYAAAHLVIRDGANLLGVTQVPLYGEELDPAKLAPILAAYPRFPQESIDLALPRVRVVVATRDRKESLARCLDSLLAQDHPDFEIVVVDNAPSNDETMAMVQQVYASTGKVIYLREERPGLSNAHNRGLDGLSADIVAFTDDDVIADRHWLSSLVRPFAENAETGCVTGSIVPAELETRAQYWTELHGGFLKSAKVQVFDLAANRPDNPLFPYAAGMFGSGANMAFRRSALSAMGGFEPALGAGTIARGGDDLAAFADVVLAGERLVYNPHALVWHFHRRSADGMARQAFGYGVGLGAYLTRLIVRQPSLAWHFLAKAPAGFAHLFGRKSAKNARLPGDYPASFVWRERFGILAGIPAYFRSRKALRRPNDATPLQAQGKPAWKSN